MGAFFTNYQVRSDSADQVKDAFIKLGPSRAFISPAKNGWVTIFDEQSDEQDDAVLRKIAMALSRSLKTSVIAFLCHDSDIAMYFLYRNGQLDDEYNSSPDDFKPSADESRYAGDPDALLPLCVAATSREEIAQILHSPSGAHVMAEEIIIAIARLLGIEENRAALGFRYFEEDGADALDDADQFIPIGNNAKPPTKSPIIEAARAAASDPVARIAALASTISLMCYVWSETGPMAEPAAIKLMQTQFDRQIPDLIRNASVSSAPSYEELKTARDAGPETFAALIAARVPDVIPNIAFGVTLMNCPRMLAALFTHGLDPAVPIQGQTLLDIAQRHGKQSAIYQLIKSASKS